MYQNQNPYYQQPQYYSPTLYGKIVDCYETAKAQDVPFNQSGLYPKADGTEVYLKQWCPDGTTRVDIYKKAEQVTSQANQFEEILNQIYERLDELKPPKKKKVEVVEDDE